MDLDQFIVCLVSEKLETLLFVLLLEHLCKFVNMFSVDGDILWSTGFTKGILLVWSLIQRACCWEWRKHVDNILLHKLCVGEKGLF